jgi:ABC-type uncharacterized transport system permease subunit
MVFTAVVVLYFYLKNSLVTESVGSSAVTFGLPLALAAMVGIICERTGVVNIGIRLPKMTLTASSQQFVLAASSGSFFH